MIFENRVEAGQYLAKELNPYANHPHAIVLALPRGGVVVGYEVASSLHLPLDITCPRKIGAPFNPELAIGAVTETGEGIMSDKIIVEWRISKSDLQAAISQEKEEAIRRLKMYRQGRPPRQIQDKTVILIDDGVATGATMRAAIKTCRAEKVGTLILAVPVAPQDTLEQLKKEVDLTICLTTPTPFFAVGQFYKQFEPTRDDEVIDLLSK
jgi:putative phosphoribosyl transferase